MTAPIPPQLQGTHAPSQLEVLWEKNRRTITLIAIAVLVAIGLNTAVGAYVRAKTNKRWSEFATVTRLDKGYDNQDLIKNQNPMGSEHQLPGILAREVAKSDPAILDKAVAAAGSDEKPYLLWVAASQAVMTGQYPRADELLNKLQTEYPNHSLCMQSPYPVQFRQEKDKDKTKPETRRKADLENAEPGTMVERLRQQITHARDFKEPANFQQQPIPTDAIKVQVETSLGSFTVALLQKEAPKHVEAFLKLLEEPQAFFGGMRIDEINRTASKYAGFPRPVQFHFGLEGSKQEDRTKWVAKDPSTHQVDYEYNDCSHFPGAISGRQEGTKSCVDRLWVCTTDNVAMDGNRVIFAYVVDGMDVVRRIGEVPLATQGEEELGSGKPQDDIKIVSVKKLN